MPAALDALKRTPRYVIRYGLTLAIIVASYFALRPLGVSLHPAVSILFGFALTILIDFALPGDEARKALMRQHAKSLWDMCRPFKLALAWALVAIFAAELSSEPEEPFVAAVLTHSGSLVVLLVCGFSVMTMLQSVVAGVTALLRGLALYAITVFLIGGVGDPLYRYIAAAPSEHGAIMATTAAICALFTFVAYCGLPAPSEAPVSAAPTARPMTRRPTLTADELRAVAVHEIGHALVLAALDTIPESTSLTIYDVAQPSGVNGRLSFEVDNCRLPQAMHLRWWMLLHLAGAEAERQFLGHSPMGGSDDLAKWQADARAYLSCGWRGIFYTPPTNALEQQHNSDAFVALQEEQRALLRQLFADNAAIHAELTELLIERATLSYADIAPLLARVVVPAGFSVSDLKGWRVATHVH